MPPAQGQEGETPSERRWRTLLENALPRTNDSHETNQGSIPINLQSLRTMVRQHIGAQTCPSSVDRSALVDIALRLRLISAEAADKIKSNDVRTSSSTKKRSRIDRADNIKRRKVVKLNTVKCALLSRIRCGLDPSLSLRVVNAIKSRVEAYSRRIVNGSLALNGIIRSLFKADYQDNSMVDNFSAIDFSWILDVDLPQEIFTQTFIRQLLLGTESAKKPSPIIEQFHECHPQLLLEGRRQLGDRNIYSAGATQYLTNLKNALRTELDDRIKIACRRDNTLQSDDVKVVFYLIHGWQLPPSFGCCLPLSRTATDFVSIHRRMLGLEETTKVDDRWLSDDSNLPHMLRYNVFLNVVYQSMDSTLFNIVPVCNIRAHFIRIDTSVLYGILREVGVISQSMSASLFDQLRDVFWFDTFDFRKIKTSRSNFGWSVTTDGISLCTTFEKEAEALPVGSSPSSPTYVPTSNDKVVGNDPGRVNIYFMAAIDNGKTKVAKLTRRQYYTESGCTTARVNSERWNKGIKDHLDAFSTASTKGVSWTAYK